MRTSYIDEVKRSVTFHRMVNENCAPHISRRGVLINPSLRTVSSGLGKLMEFYILRWLYTDVVYLDDVDVTLSLLQAAVKFKLDPLFDRCEEALMQTVSVSSCAGVHGVALTTESMKLVDCCERIASKYLDVIMSEVPWNAPSEASVEVRRFRAPTDSGHENLPFKKPKGRRIESIVVAQR